MANVLGDDVEFKIALKMYPFTIQRIIPSNVGKIKAVTEDAGAYPSPGPKTNQPFDLVISCSTDNFKIYVNDMFVADFTKLHIISSTLRTIPTVTRINYAKTSMAITKLTWNYGNKIYIHVKIFVTLKYFLFWTHNVQKPQTNFFVFE